MLDNHGMIDTKDQNNLTDRIAQNHQFMSEPNSIQAPPRIMNRKINIKLQTKNLFNQLKGPSVLGNGSVNQVKIMKEEFGFQKMFDREVMPLCLYSETPK